MSDEAHHSKFEKLIAFLSRVPAVANNDTPSRGFGSGEDKGGAWWVKFMIDIEHDLAWHTVQELGCVLNYLSLEERLPTVFKPVSPAPYMNGGPEEFLSWVIEGKEMPPGTVAKWLEERLPKPVEDEAAWLGEPDEDSGDDDEEEAFGNLEDDD